MYIKKSALILSFCFAVAAVAVLAGFIVRANNGTADIKQIGVYSYQQSCAELAESLDAINTQLQKSLYSSSPYQATVIAATVWKEAGTATASLERLPTDTLNLQKIPKFLNQSGEYVMYLAKKLMNGGELSESDRETVQNLSDIAQNLSIQMTELQYRINSENLSYDDFLEFIQLNDTPTPEENAETVSAIVGGEGSDNAAVSEFISENPFLNMENGLSLPELNYDGPFSEHLYRLTSVFLDGKEAISDEEAKNRAAYILGCNLSDLKQGGDITVGDMKCVSFSSEELGLDIIVTMRQGYPYMFEKYRDVGDITLTDEEAIDIGGKFLTKLRIAGMECVYYNVSGNILTAEYVYVQNEVYCYPDMIKLSIALDNGEILALDAHSYLLAHTTDRKLRPYMTESEAAAKVTVLTPDKIRLCVIPTNGYEEKEKLCYEISGKGKDGETVYIYVNALSGVEEEIKIVYDTENGKVRFD